MPLSRSRDLRRPGAGDPDVARGRAGATAGDDRRRSRGAAGLLSLQLGRQYAPFRHCEEPTGPALGGPDDKLRDEAIHSSFWLWIASRSLSSGGALRRPDDKLRDEAIHSSFWLWIASRSLSSGGALRR